jgi:hypothetical protein
MFPLLFFYAAAGIISSLILISSIYLFRWRWLMQRKQSKTALIHLHSVDIPTALEIASESDALEPGKVSCHCIVLDPLKKHAQVTNAEPFFDIPLKTPA